MSSEAWKQYFDTCSVITERNAELVEQKFRECETYVETVLKKKYPDCGIVYTRRADRIKEGRFTIWIDNGSITHRNFRFEDCGIKPLELFDYPVRPDQL